MSVIADTFWAMNELTASVSQSVTAFSLGSGDELVRSLSIGTDWNKLRLSFRYSLSGSASTGNLTGFRFFGGFCAGYTGRFNQSNNHCAGFMIGGYPDGNTTTLTEHTHVSTSVAGQAFCWTGNFFSYRQINNSGTGSSALANSVMPRYETQWSSSYVYYNLMGYPWAEACTDINKNIGSGSLSSSICWAAFGSTQFGDVPPYVISKPKGVFRMAAEATTAGQPGSTAGNWGNCMLNFFNDVGVSGQTYQGSNAHTVTLDEATYGYLNSINFYFQCSTPGVKLLLRDIIVTKIE